MGFLLVETPELGVQDQDLDVDETISLYCLTSSDGVPVKKFISQTPGTNARKIALQCSLNQCHHF